ncbi:hypothetical protein [Arthrobacter crystallopoietes]|uniref:Uncharacterized protein n=1 Tax=Crystallibacter crystallopoietes TaxID=37928 RepID=A0A1H0ZN71_9MICC|nr:hypothetical protein [Arthrobacter crystallopoietes]AUI51898.1 hypothetical protein AC20117_14980 [Arthrobacter crystallopoietes]SDQ28787.1 hypothetical protein SAMN04489742_0462 [Arthrobacter crystallopoietes]
MNCDQLAATGLPITALIALAVAFVAAGLLLVAAARRRGTRRGGVAVLLLLLLFAGGSGAGVSAAQAVPDCSQEIQGPVVIGPNKEVTAVQISTINGVAPGADPALITGTVTNNSTETRYIAAVTVRASSLAMAPEAAPGACDLSDYILTDVRMPVGRTLAPGESTVFTGAKIGFNNKSVNQDACKLATVTLRYDVS